MVSCVPLMGCFSVPPGASCVAQSTFSDSCMAGFLSVVSAWSAFSSSPLPSVSCTARGLPADRAEEVQSLSTTPELFPVPLCPVLIAESVCGCFRGSFSGHITTCDSDPCGRRMCKWSLADGHSEGFHREPHGGRCHKHLRMRLCGNLVSFLLGEYPVESPGVTVVPF